MLRCIGIIGGTALQSMDGLQKLETVAIETEYGRPSAKPLRGRLGDTELIFLSRHGDGHTLAPHQINYRANIKALQQLGVTEIVAVASVGGITPACGPATLLIPDQLIDYTHGRIASFFEDDFSIDKHVDFTEPYSDALRRRLLDAAAASQLQVNSAATMAVTQGPRLETAAEIRRLRSDGCDIVGMTGMPEAVLARELQIPYASLAIVVNWAAGITKEVITLDDIKSVIADSDANIKKLLTAYCKI